MVRGNAALSLVRFGDATGRPQIVASAAAGAPYRSRGRSCFGCRSPRDGDSSGRLDRQAGGRQVADDRLAADRRNPFPDSGTNPFSLPNGRKCRCRRGGRGESILRPNKYGKPCGLCTWWDSPTICPPCGPTNATCPMFPTMFGSKRPKRRRRFCSEPSTSAERPRRFVILSGVAEGTKWLPRRSRRIATQLTSFVPSQGISSTQPSGR